MTYKTPVTKNYTTRLSMEGKLGDTNLVVNEATDSINIYVDDQCITIDKKEELRTLLSMLATIHNKQ
jgi:hypothetical protein